MCPSSCCPSSTFRRISVEPEFFAVLPRIYRTQDEPILRALLEDAAKKGVTGVSIGNLGHLSLVRGLDAALHGDWALNVYNSAALAFWKEQGLSSACVSFELRDAQIRDLSKCLPVRGHRLRPPSRSWSRRTA